MSFINKMKNTIGNFSPKNLSDETVRVVSEDEDFEEPQEEFDDTSEDDFTDEEEDNSAFVVDKKDSVKGFLKKKQKQFDDEMEEYSNVPTPKVLGDKIQDVLEVLQIPENFEVPAEVLMPEDLKKIEFDKQAPYGYDMGQVSAFMDKVRVSLKTYVNFINQRSEHIASLATVVDRLQTDNANLKWDSEIANGINIMPTQPNEELENKYMEAKLEIKRLKSIISNRDEPAGLSDREREAYDSLQDEFSSLRRKYESSLDEIDQLNMRIALLEENQEYGGDDNSQSDGPKSFEESNFDSSEYLYSDENEGSEEELLPEIEDFDSSDKEMLNRKKKSAFNLEEEEDLGDFLDANSENFNHEDSSDDSSDDYENFIDYSDDDEDDDIDKMMNDWKN